MSIHKWAAIPLEVSHVAWDNDEDSTFDVVLDTIQIINQMLEGVNIKAMHQKSVDPNIVYIFAETKKETQ